MKPKDRLKKGKRQQPPAAPEQTPSSADASAASVPVTGWRAVMREPIAVGLTPLILMRPWLDGVTYPTDNLYFVWGIILLFVIWGFRVLLHGETIRFKLPLALLAGFWFVAALTALSSVQFDATYRTLILWAGHLFLFAIATNGLRSRLAINIVLGALAVCFLAETVWSLLHFRYVLPFVRQSVLEDPRLLKTYFGSTTPSPELVHRLNVNRAFGSLLFPNALAAFLVLAVPFALTESIASLRQARRVFGSRPGGARPGDKGFDYPRSAKPASPFVVLLGTGVAWLLSVAAAWFIADFVASFEFPSALGVGRMGPVLFLPDGGMRAASGLYALFWVLFVALLPLCFAAATAVVLRRWGVSALPLLFRAVGLPPILLLGAVALWLTYSRGGLLALAVSVAFVAALFALRQRRGWNASRAVVAAGIAASALAVCVQGAGGMAWAQAAPQNDGVPAAAQTESAQPAPPSTPQPVPESGPGPEQAIVREGTNLTLTDLASPASFWLRLTYWQTGLNMALDNLWTGVGLGNFGTVYAKYQRPGAGDVKAAHNDYLQALCETGVFGFLPFCLFWSYVVGWGAWWLWRQQEPQRWLAGAGLYAGMLAFLIHSVVDFNFFNPALAFFVFLMAGVFLSRAALAAPEPVARAAARSSSRWHAVAVLPFLLLAAFVVSMAVRVFMSDLIIGHYSFVSVGNQLRLNTLLDAGQFFYQPKVSGAPKSKYAVKDIATVAALIPDQEVLERIGALRMPASGTPEGHRALRPGEAVTRDAFFVLTKPLRAKEEAEPYVEQQLGALKQADAIFPHSPVLAAYFIQWYEILANEAATDEARRRYTVELLQWSKTAVDRSPEQFLYREWLGRALWTRGNIETTAARKTYFEQGLEEYRRAAELYPASSEQLRLYGAMLVKYGQALDAARDPEGRRYVTEGTGVMQRAEQMKQSGQSL